MLKQPIYLVPVDFTDVSAMATRLALDLAEANDGSAYLLHITDNKANKSDARRKLAEIFDELSIEDQGRATTKVIVGDLYEDMGKAGELLKAALIVMGTHGASGMQKVFGSNAIKMIRNSGSPFLITQGKKSVDKLKTIVMPFSFAKETIQITSFAGIIAKQFKAKIHLVGFHDKDQWLEHKVQSNQLVVRKHLTDNDVAHEIVNLPRTDSYEKELMDYANKVDADIIAAAYFKEGIMPTPNSFMQMMLENELNIPVLTVNSEELSVVNSNYSFMTV